MSKVDFGETLSKVGNGVVEGLKLALCVGLISLPYLSTGNTKRTVSYGKVGYDDAVKAVVSSGMYSHDKATVVGLLKQDASSEYYNAVISIVRSGMYSHEKINAIEKISK